MKNRPDNSVIVITLNLSLALKNTKFVLQYFNNMPEITIKYKNLKTLQALVDIAKYFDFTIKTPVKAKSKKKSLPIEFAEKPDVTALAGIWKDKEMTLEQLREKAWGNRL